jgi:hypothetical protein
VQSVGYLTLYPQIYCSNTGFNSQIIHVIS